MSKRVKKGIVLMLLSSLLTCTGQLLWKLSSLYSPVPFFLGGAFAYGGGAMLMILALRYGDLSTLHPLLSAGYVMSLFLGFLVLGEPVSAQKIFGMCMIMAGLFLICRSSSAKS